MIEETLMPSNGRDKHVTLSKLPKEENTAPTGFATIEEALAELRAGRFVIVADDAARENEGDLVGAAEFVTPELINFCVTEARSCVCLTLTESKARELQLPLMVEENSQQQGTAFTITVDADTKFGVSTGVSTFDRAKTIQVAVNPDCKPTDLRRPGHIFPLVAKPGGVLQRA